MSKLPSFEYKKMIFHNVKDNLFQTDKFGDKLIYKFENGKYHLVKDERLSSVIGTDEVCGIPNSMFNNDYWWKQYLSLVANVKCMGSVYSFCQRFVFFLNSY